MNITVIGNCQARPIAELLSKSISRPAKVETIIAHLAHTYEPSEIKKLLENSDIIITQRIADNFTCPDIVTSNIRKRVNASVLVIHNLYFRGYNPELVYIRFPGEGTLTGPLGDYHHQLIFEAWRSNYTKPQAEEYCNELAVWERKFTGIFQSSLLEFKEREKFVDVKMLNSIQEHFASRRLFFTFNHPTAFLLKLQVDKIIDALGLAVIDAELTNEPLDLIVPPLSNYTINSHSLLLPNVQEFKGLQSQSDGSFKRPAYYSLSQLIDIFYGIYYENEERIKTKSRIPHIKD